jgi:hypothetical protein
MAPTGSNPSDFEALCRIFAVQKEKAAQNGV